VVAKALEDPRVRGRIEPVLVGPTGTGVAVSETIGEWSASDGESAAGRLAGRAIERAVALARDGVVQGIVTAPIDKHALLAGGYDFPGHTEMLARLTGARVAMMLAGTRATAGPGAHPLRVVLATTHIPLREVPAQLTRGVILDAARTTREGLRVWYGIADPRIALCALNPHAGDGGRFGAEDDTLLAPTARDAGLLGPYPADTVFVRAMRGAFDAVIAPYHDVGMTAIKVAAFGAAVNVTLGLPFPRTSPDHGTALDIAGQGIADAGSTVAAIMECARIVEHLAAGAGARDGGPA
jgi:4-hydroxythreonine-4-phosphate dehydrogenase